MIPKISLITFVGKVYNGNESEGKIMGDKKAENNQKVLLVIDIQEDYTGDTATRPFPYKDSDQFIAGVNKIIEAASMKNIIVVYIKQEFDNFMGKMFSQLFCGGTAIKGSPGAQIDKRINIKSDFCFSKPGADAFSSVKFREFLNEYKVSELYLVGLDAQFCIYSTAKGAKKHGYDVTIIKDGIILMDEKKWDELLKNMNVTVLSLFQV